MLHLLRSRNSKGKEGSENNASRDAVKLGGSEADLKAEGLAGDVKRARRLVECVPESNWFKRNPRLSDSKVGMILMTLITLITLLALITPDEVIAK